jgi:hypothetical protein
MQLRGRMAQTLAGVPTEILLRICEFLTEAHAPSLLSFALASKHCHSIANVSLFRRLTFIITTPARLRAHARKCINLLERNQAFGHVKCLVLVGCIGQKFDVQAFLHNSGSEEEDRFNYHGWKPTAAPSFNWDVNHLRLHDLPDYSESRLPVRADQTTTVKAGYDTDAAWAPLAELIRLLPGLIDLIYQCPTQFPPCLLRALHDRTPSHIIRLHLRSFKLRMLPEDPAAAITVDPHELALITSPCLHSVWVLDECKTPSVRAGDILLGRQAEALENMMKTEGLAPNLREVRMLQYRPHHGQEACQPPSWGWLPAEIGGKDRKQKVARLYHLELSIFGGFRSCFSEVEFQYWNGLADLSALQTLNLAIVVDERALDRLLSLRFPALATLALRCTTQPSAVYFDKAKRFIRGLPRLRQLNLINWDWYVAPLVADPEGTSSNNSIKTLRSLRLDHNPFQRGNYAQNSEPTRLSIASAWEIIGLGDLFPYLETLTLCIHRSRGDSDEVARYRALGSSFHRLRRLALILEPLPPHPRQPPNPESTVFEDQPSSRAAYTNGHIMSVMANSALDAKLARQIFEAVASPSLETMMVKPEAGGMFRGTDGLRPWLNGLAREWVVDRVNLKGELQVREIGRNAEGWKGVTRDPLRVRDKNPYWAHFRGLWPESKEEGNWWYDDWESCYLVNEI